MSFQPDDTVNDGQDLLARPSLWKRLAVAALVVIAGAPIVPWPHLLAWSGLMIAASLAELRIARRAGFIAADAPGLAVSCATSALYAVAAGVLIAQGGPGARLFAVALAGFAAVNVLLRFYAAPRLLMAALSPLILIMGWVHWRLAVTQVEAGHLLEALTPAATIGVLVLMLWPARTRLAKARAMLIEARACAQARADAEARASRAKSEFLSTMSHEIRTPLNGLLGMAQALQSEPLTPGQAEKLRIIRGSGETLLAILDDVLDLSRVEAGELQLEFDEFDLEHLTRGAVAIFASVAAKKNLSFAFTIEAEAKGVYRGDPVRLRQILYNLVSNALKFTEAGGVGVTVAYADGEAVIEVADSGRGIAADRIETLFGSFVQGDASITRRVGGAGLGLAISRSLAELMGGRIEVSSVEAKGSLFRLVVPLERIGAARPLEVADAAAAPAQGDEPARQIRILAAEDNEVNRLVLRTLLSQAGVEPRLVENGSEAVEAWRSEPWDLILMDIQMPVMDGVTATREIRSLEAASGRPRTPIIAVTANAMTHQLPEYAAAGIDAVVPKPLQAPRLFEALEQALEAA